MSGKNGFIKLHRQLLDWEWYTDANTFRVFIDLLLRASFKDVAYKGITIKRGQILTTTDEIATRLNLTRMQVRVTLEHLQATCELSHEKVLNRSMITVQNYDLFYGKYYF